MRVRGLGDGGAIFPAIVITLTFFLSVALFFIGMGIKDAYSAEAEVRAEQLKLCTAEEAVELHGAIKKLAPEGGEVTMAGPAATAFLKGLKSATQGKVDLPGSRLIFVLLPEQPNQARVWVMFGFDEKDGKECGYGRLHIPHALLERAVEMTGDPGI